MSRRARSGRARGGGLAALALAVALGACASSGATTGGAAPGEGTIIRIENNEPGGSTVTVSVVPEVGIRRTLGQVTQGATRDFPYDGSPGNYRLLALRDVGGELRSENFRLFANALVRWNMATNNVLVSGR